MDLAAVEHFYPIREDVAAKITANTDDPRHNFTLHPGRFRQDHIRRRFDPA
jgi:hypothetical protein